MFVFLNIQSIGYLYICSSRRDRSRGVNVSNDGAPTMARRRHAVVARAARHRPPIIPLAARYRLGSFCNPPPLPSLFVTRN